MSLNLEVKLLGDTSNLQKNTAKATQSLSKFETTANRMGRNIGRVFAGLGIAFGVQQVGRFLLESAKAAGEDQRAQRLLADQLQRTAGAKEADIAATEAMIARMEMATGVADDELRPAMVKLVTVTRSVSKAQTLLKLAMGASAKTGKPLEQTATAIAKAYAGQTTSLFRLLPNLKNSKDWMADLARETQGLAAQQADPFEKMARGLDRIKETIGGPLVERFNTFIGSFDDADWAMIDKSVQGIADGMETFFSVLGDGDAKLGVLRSIQSIASAIEFSFQVAAGFAALLSGRKVNVDPNSALGRAFTDLGYVVDPETGTWGLPKRKNLWLDTPGMTPRGNNSSGTNITYNIYGRAMTAKEIAAELRKENRGLGFSYVPRGGR